MLHTHIFIFKLKLPNADITMCYSTHPIFISLARAFVEAIFFNNYRLIFENQLILANVLIFSLLGHAFGSKFNL